MEAVLDAITGAMKAGDDVRLVSFGTFSVAARAASEVAIPHEIKIPAKRPKFQNR